VQRVERCKDGSPFGLGGLWENWKDPATGEWIRTFAIITTDPTTEIHSRKPLIIASHRCPLRSPKRRCLFRCWHQALSAVFMSAADPALIFGLGATSGGRDLSVLYVTSARM
jgi:hypothetical protein